MLAIYVRCHMQLSSFSLLSSRCLLSTSCSQVRWFYALPHTYIAHVTTSLERELGFLLTSVLAIPLADSLPTPNARKTCALAIFLIQTQRLPDDVLEPAKDRIVYALRRGIEGELGKEGKKGSINDGLRVCFLHLSHTYKY